MAPLFTGATPDPNQLAVAEDGVKACLQRASIMRVKKCSCTMFHNMQAKDISYAEIPSSMPSFPAHLPEEDSAGAYSNISRVCKQHLNDNSGIGWGLHTPPQGLRLGSHV